MTLITTAGLIPLMTGGPIPIRKEPKARYTALSSGLIPPHDVKPTVLITSHYEGVSHEEQYEKAKLLFGI